MGDVLAYADVNVQPHDTIFARSHVGLEEIPTHSQFQIRDLIIKSPKQSLKYRIVMESLY